jgi:hypothetical protein
MKKLLLVIGISVGIASSFAGNPERAGSAGASELRINPWARSSGLAGLNTANVKGLEAMNSNIAGMAFNKGTEILFSYSDYLRGTDIAINSFGISQGVGASGTIGVQIFSMNFGDIDITNFDNPQGGIGTFNIQYLNFALAYSKEFSNSIYGGLVVRAIQETISNVQASGFALDAGIQYVTGAKDQAQFGIALRNWGTKMKTDGDGLSFPATRRDGGQITGQARSQSFELPALLNIGGSYRIDITEQDALTLVGNFTANSFRQDQFGLGAEVMVRNYLQLRAGYNYENGIGDDFLSTPDAHTGLTYGASVEIPIKDSGSAFGVDYAYKVTNVFQGTHVIGVRLTLK